MIRFIASEPHYAQHLRPVRQAMPTDLDVWLGVPEATPDVTVEDVAVVASYGDLKKATKRGYRRIVLMQHGAGQSYAGRGNDRQGAYPGGDGNEAVGLFLCPNDYSAQRWRDRYPRAKVQVVGSPRVEHLPQREPGDVPTVAVSFHWLCNLWPETRPAFGQYKPAIPSLKRWRVLGHGHPRAMRWLVPWYRTWGIEVVPSFDDICRRADVYVCDNSSTLFEFAATGRGVVVLNSSQYRKDVNHGGRFWDWATVGLQVDSPDALQEAVRLALLDPPGIREERERIVRQVYAQVSGSTQSAVNSILEWI